MAITAGAQRGKAPYQVNGSEAVAPVQLGNSVYVTTPAATTTVSLPVDPQGNAYPCYRFTSSGSIQWGFGPGPAVVNQANQFTSTIGAVMDIFAPAGATQVTAILDAASTTGSLCIIGLY